MQLKKEWGTSCFIQIKKQSTKNCDQIFTGNSKKVPGKHESAEFAYISLKRVRTVNDCVHRVRIVRWNRYLEKCYYAIAQEKEHVENARQVFWLAAKPCDIQYWNSRGRLIYALSVTKHCNDERNHTFSLFYTFVHPSWIELFLFFLISFAT